MAKLKPLSPTLKERKRYLAYSITGKSLRAEDVEKAVIRKFQEMYGDYGLASAGIIFLKDTFSRNKGLIRVNHKNVNHLKAALTLIPDINHDEILIKSNGVSGTIKKALTFIRGNDGGTKYASNAAPINGL